MSTVEAGERIVVRLCGECWSRIHTPGIVHVHDGRLVPLSEIEAIVVTKPTPEVSNGGGE
jgi:hypothetical protein